MKELILLGVLSVALVAGCAGPGVVVGPDCQVQIETTSKP